MAYTLLGDERIRIHAAVALDKATQLAPGTIANVSADGIEVACNEGVLKLTSCNWPGKNRWLSLTLSTASRICFSRFTYFLLSFDHAESIWAR